MTFDRMRGKLATAFVLAVAPCAAQAAEHVCVVKPYMVVEIGSAVQGVLQRVTVRRGDQVKEGEVVGEIESGVQAAEVALARIRAGFEDRKLARSDQLKNLIAPQERDENETKQKMAHGELSRAEAELARRTIRSPISGVVVERNNDPGEFIKDSKFLKIAQIDPLIVEALLPAAMFPKVHKGARVEIALHSPGSGTHIGELDVVDKLIDPASGTFGVQVTLPNQELEIPAGITCDLRMLDVVGDQ